MENAGLSPGNAFDGNLTTRWSSQFSDPQWIQVDLGSVQTICQVALHWETAYGKAFQVQTSNDATTWTPVFTTTTGTGGTQTLNVTGSGRYVRMYGTARGTGYGYSLWEFQVFGTGGGGGNTVTVTNPGNQTTAAGAAVRLQIQATDSASGQTLAYSATGLPAGLSISTAGLITGTPTATGTSTVSVTAKDATGASANAAFTWTVSTGNSGAPPPQFWGNTAAIPAATHVLELAIVNQTNGQYPDSQVYWSFNGQTASIAQQPYIDMPANSAGRMYFYLGTPNGPYYDFIEFTVGTTFINVDTTRVDRFGLKLALLLHGHDGSDQEVGENYATFQESRAADVPAGSRTRCRPSSRSWPPTRRRTASPRRATTRRSSPAAPTRTTSSSYAAANGDTTDTTAQIFGCGGTLREQPPAVRRAQPARRAAAGRAAVRSRATSTRPPRRTTTPSSGTRTRSTVSSTASPTTTTRASPRTSR